MSRSAPAIPSDLTVRMMSVGLWLIVAFGPLLGATALLRPASPAALPESDQPPAAAIGLAELSVAAHLQLRPADVPDLLSPAVPGFRVTGAAMQGIPTEALEADLSARRTLPTHIGTVGVRPAGPQRWGVLVGIVSGAGMQTYQVTVAMAEAGPLVESLPVLVPNPRPDRYPSPAVSSLREPESNANTAAIDGFITAYLTGSGDLERYTSAEARVTPPEPLIQSVDLLRLGTAPYGDAQTVVLAEVRTVGLDGVIQVMHLPLLTERTGGRLEIRQLLPAIPLTAPTG